MDNLRKVWGAKVETGLLHKLDQLELAALKATTTDRLDGISDDLSELMVAAGPIESEFIGRVYLGVLAAIDLRHAELTGG